MTASFLVAALVLRLLDGNRNGRRRPDRPGPEMRIIPGTYELDFVDRRIASIRFEAIHVL